MCGHPSGLRTPYEMVMIARAKLDAMQRHPGLAWLRAEDAAEHCPPRRQAKVRWWPVGS
jgi:hypothetical protein